MSQDKLIKIGISACLAGESVRYDGSNIYNEDLCKHLSSVFTLIPVCPEVAVGMGVPRAPIQLVGEPATARALGVQTPSLDVTDKLTDYAKHTLQSCPDLDGFVVKARSPSCGLKTTPVFNNRNVHTGTGSGIFTRTLLDTYPGMPVIDESYVNSMVSLELFIMQICVYSVFRQRVLAAEDRQMALDVFHKNLSNTVNIQMTRNLPGSEQVSDYGYSEKTLVRYARQLLGQLSIGSLSAILRTKINGANSVYFDSKRVNEFLDKLKGI